MPFLGPERLLRTRCARAVFAAAFLFNFVAVQASNLNFLNDTPLSYMKPRDMDSIKRALTDVLNTKSDGEASQWTNAGTGNSVKIDAMMTPSDTSHDGKKTCRHVAIVLSAKGQSMNLHPVFCGTGKTDWALQKR
ncbi:hypothetical protein J8I87_30455 [Paraburkholderia sp. LEh10]|uniref:hypothetical protein n=1 Tax=Paraburkholderia sp. LEh10 TaxID=2821353 RepID=UPI001AE69D46|nr:hypothetical protein [Paraburkholderia sp. LEh10]MBP0593926.1 hypothetical protein [Paraburkholderia sp. LEh10]